MESKRCIVVFNSQASPNLANDTLGLSLAYFTLVDAMVSVLLSTLMLFHISGRDQDESFILSLTMEMKSCSAFSLWNVWTMVALPSIWSIWTTVLFITVTVLQIWRQPDTFIVSAVLSPAVATIGAPSVHQYTLLATALTTTLFTGIFQIIGTAVGFWKIGRKWANIDKEAGQNVAEVDPSIVATQYTHPHTAE